MEIFFQTYTKTQNGLKTWISDLKLLEENLEKNLFDISLGIFLYDSNSTGNKNFLKTDQWDFTKSFCTAREMTNKVKRQPRE